ncbi:uncharacterized protein LOC111628461 [Centruroides sculpturatus]|uniref:uncharacterized protein LOC111628461 n=1 Tax=Centruroides sculpturatus TaxID=218467 RepID=UPI000C6E42C9|nr:uncharacterized protein LOC111628461 [Centruroides sculpturatus]
MKDFYEWKVTEELRTNSKYSAPCGPRTKKSRGENKYYFYCNRTGRKRYKQLQSKRPNRCLESCKIQDHCTSAMNVLEGRNNVQVTYIKPHYGHDCKLGHIPLLNETRQEIAGNNFGNIKYLILHKQSST